LRYTVAVISLIGGLYKNLTLPAQGISIIESARLAAIVIPAAVLGGIVGGRLMYILPKNVIRTVFLILLAVASYRLLTVPPGV